MNGEPGIREGETDKKVDGGGNGDERQAVNDTSK
jgi:hypothetical protein